MGANQSSKQQLQFAQPIGDHNKNGNNSSIRSTKSQLRSLRKGMSNLLNHNNNSNSNNTDENLQNYSPKDDQRGRKFFLETKSSPQQNNHHRSMIMNEAKSSMKPTNNEFSYLVTQQQQQQQKNGGHLPLLDSSEMMKRNIDTQRQQFVATSLGRRAPTAKQLANGDFLPTESTPTTRTIFNDQQQRAGELKKQTQHQQHQIQLQMNNGNYDATSTATANNYNTNNKITTTTTANQVMNNKEQTLFTSPQMVQRQQQQQAATTTDCWLPQTTTRRHHQHDDGVDEQRQLNCSTNESDSRASYNHHNNHVATSKTTAATSAVVMPSKQNHEKLLNSSLGAKFTTTTTNNNNSLFTLPNHENQSAASQLVNSNNLKHHHRASSESWSQSTPLRSANNYYHQQATYGNNISTADSELDATDPVVYDRLHGNELGGAIYYDEIPTNNNNNCSASKQQHLEDDLEHFYSRNLHLLDPADQLAQQAQFSSPDFEYNQQQQAYINYPLAATSQAGQQLGGTPLQRRYKRPKQQYQYLNNQPRQPIIDYFDYYQQQQPSSAATTQFVDHLSSTTSLHKQHNRRSKSLSNPLAAIFQQQQQHHQAHSAINSNNNYLTNNHYSNTIGSSYLSSSKSQQTLSLSQQRSHQAGNNSNSGGSLKRIKSSPLSAQQASYEAMRTIDMYLIRQIARNCRDFELEQKIDLEIRLRELAAQSMLEARTEIDLLEVEKSLLTSDQRMNCYAAQLEEQRKQLSNPSLSTDSGRGSKVGSNNQDYKSNNNARSGSGDSVNQVSHRSDVIGGPQAPPPPPSITTTTCGADSQSSSSQSPSKLSPVSGESANSPPSFSSGRNSTQTSRSRLNHMRNNNSTTNSSNNNTLNRRQRVKHKRREQLMQKITGLSNINCNIAMNNLASLSISELRIPLMWRDVDHFKNRGDYKRYAVFCLLKIDSQIYDTQLISDVDRQQTDLTFDDLIVFNDVGYEFELTLEVYSCVYLEQFSLSSTPRKLKEKLSSSVSRAMGRRLATQTASASYTKELQAYDKSYRFAMIASAKLKLDDASDTVKTYDLVLVTPSAHNRHHYSTTTSSGLQRNDSGHNNLSNYLSSANNNYQLSLAAAGTTTTTSNQKDAQRNTLPLFGHFCCKLLVRPDVFDKNVKTGYLRVANIDLTNSLLTNGGHTETLSSSGRRQSSDSPNGGGGSSSASTSDDSTNDNSTMLRSALAASSKLANLSMANSTVHWALMRNFVLHLWPIDEQKLELALIRGHAPQVDVSRKPPFSMMIERYTKLLRVSNTSLTIETDRGCFVLAVYNPAATTVTGAQAANQHDEISQWLRAIEQSVYDSHIWGSVLNHYPPKQQSPRGKRNFASNGIS